MPPIEWLTKCLVPRTSPEFSSDCRQGLIKDLGASFVNLATQWLSFESQITPLDEIWEYDSPAEHWNSLCGSSGIALVRGQQIIAEIIIEMN